MTDNAPPPIAGEGSPRLHEQQRRALAYLDRRGTRATLANLWSEARAAFSSTEEAFAAVAEPLRALRPSPGCWSPHEILDHLVVSHRPAVGQLEGLVAGRPGDFPIAAGLQSADPFARSYAELLADLEAVHRDLLAAAESAGEETSLAVTAPIEMVVKVPSDQLDDASPLVPLHWLEQLDWKAYFQGLRVHTLEHRAQLARVLGDASATS